MREVPEYDAPTVAQFRDEIEPLAMPTVLRGVAADWPLVVAAKEGPEPWAGMLSDWATDQPLTIISTDAENEGRFHYTSDGRALNFVRSKATMNGLLAALKEQASKDRPHSLATQGVVAESLLPGFGESHRMPFVPDRAIPRLWVGNAAKVASHNDPNHNIAVVVAGRRRFTLFPPSEAGNLYLGPLEFTPAGVPISMVHVTAPDLETYPRFALALEAAQTADLGPGDALFIPYAWYHHVESIEPANMLVNYWWNDARADIGSARNAMFHALLSLRPLPPNQRAAWKALFDHYVFGIDGDPADTIDPQVAGVLGPMTPETIASLRRALIDALSRDAEREPPPGGTDD